MQDKPFTTHAPFGVATKKFTKIGFHPELDKSGAMKREITKVGPGSFNPRRHQCKFKQGMRCFFEYTNFPFFTVNCVLAGSTNWNWKSFLNIWDLEMRIFCKNDSFLKL